MAQVRAQTSATKINVNDFHPGQPRLSRAAMAIEASAKGRAKIVWENLTNSAHLRMTANTPSVIGPPPLKGRLADRPYVPPPEARSTADLTASTTMAPMPWSLPPR